MTTTTQTAVTINGAVTHIANRTGFKANGTFSGSHFGLGIGRLPADRVSGFLKAMDADDFYVVYSYGTPIAWHAHGTWTVPDVRYSVTTTRHQNTVRKAVAR